MTEEFERKRDAHSIQLLKTYGVDALYNDAELVVTRSPFASSTIGVGLTYGDLRTLRQAIDDYLKENGEDES